MNYWIKRLKCVRVKSHFDTIRKILWGKYQVRYIDTSWHYEL